MVMYRKLGYVPRKRKTYTRPKPKVNKEIKKYVKRVMPKPEVKRCLDGYSEQIVSATVAPSQIFEPVINQGTAKNQRVGCSIKLIGLYQKFFLKNNSVGTQLIRHIVVSCDSDTDCVAGTMELFKDITTAGLTTTIASSGTSMGNCLFRINDAKFKVHHDKVHKLGASTATDGTDVKVVKYFKKFNSTIKYEGDLTGEGNQSRRFLTMFLTSDPALDSGGGSIEISGNNYWYFVDA
jgi:hypothetical protein